MHVSGFGVIPKRHHRGFVVTRRQRRNRPGCVLTELRHSRRHSPSRSPARPRGANCEDRRQACVPSGPRSSGRQASPRYVLAGAGVRRHTATIRALFSASDFLGGCRRTGVDRESAYGEWHTRLPLYRRLRHSRPPEFGRMRSELAIADADMREFRCAHRVGKNRGPIDLHHSVGHRDRYPKDGAAPTGRKTRAPGAHSVHMEEQKVGHPQRP